VRASPFAPEIDVLGFVPETEIANWYRAADMLVFPSLYEGFGLPPLEAMACGCPVLSSGEGALGETVGEAAGHLEPRDVSQIQAQLTRAASDQAWRGKLRAAGLDRAHNFDWSKTAESTLRVYSRAVLGNTRQGAIQRGVMELSAGAGAFAESASNRRASPDPSGTSNPILK
jgi:glycosyltransferase involved in cell wall biosynthesis